MKYTDCHNLKSEGTTMRKSLMMLALVALMLSGTALSAQTITVCVDARKGTLYIPSGECKVGDAELELSIGGQAVPASAGMGFVGFSTGTTTGDAGGVGGMNLLCQNTFGPNARMANTKEYFDSNTTITPPPPAWINATLVLGDGSFVVDYSGRRFAPNLIDVNCLAWTIDSTGNGLMVDSVTGVEVWSCKLVNKVACSGPAQAP